MNFFSKNRFIFWLLCFLVVVNLSALIAFLVFFSLNTSDSAQQWQRTPGMKFRQELSLSPAQSEQVDVILAGYRESTEPLISNIRAYRAEILEELASDNPDTSHINAFVSEISSLQKQMQKASVNQYLALKEICTPLQCQRLSALYFELYGCQDSFRGRGPGKGMKHQFRRGQVH